MAYYGVMQAMGYGIERIKEGVEAGLSGANTSRNAYTGNIIPDYLLEDIEKTLRETSSYTKVGVGDDDSFYISASGTAVKADITYFDPKLNKTIGASVKNHSKLSKVQIVSGTPLLYLLQSAATTTAINDYLNIVVERVTPEANWGQMYLDQLQTQATKSILLLMAQTAMAGTTYAEKDENVFLQSGVDILISINSSKKGQASVDVMNIGDIEKIITEQDVYLGNKTATSLPGNVFNLTSEYVIDPKGGFKDRLSANKRLSNLLIQMHQEKVTMSLNLKNIISKIK